MTLTFNLLQIMVMAYSHAKVQGQRSVASEDRVETNGRTNRRAGAIALPPTLMRSVTMCETIFVEKAVYLRSTLFMST